MEVDVSDRPQYHLSKENLAKVFGEWKRRYDEDPDSFQSDEDFKNDPPKTYGEEIQYLKGWITNRMAWIDAQFPPPPLPSHPGGFMGGTNFVTLSAPTGQIFFTVDGSDPRFAGGATSTVAQVYQAPINVSNSVSTTVRAQKDNRWSPPVTSRFIKTASAR